MNTVLKHFSFFFIIITFLVGCKEDKPKPEIEVPVTKKVSVPKFDRDSAYAFIKKQVDFGPRVPNTAAHTACKNWLVKKFQSFGAEVIEQDFKAKAYTGTVYNSTNIIAQYNPANKNRIILAAHWDSRHIGDHDPDESMQNKPIPGADDGGSGVGVLLEIAAKLKQYPVDIGVDIILFDAEDNGQDEGEAPRTWCLGSQHWAANLHKAGYKAKYGILLDMVGASDARFPKEGSSMNYAPQLMNKVWKMAQNMGYGNYFSNQQTQGITDDHVFVNAIARIPMIDIINLPVGSGQRFGKHWHTHSDNMSVINKRTLRAVGQVVLAVVYNEDGGKF